MLFYDVSGDFSAVAIVEVFLVITTHDGELSAVHHTQFVNGDP